MKRLPLRAWGFIAWGTIRIGVSIASLPFVRMRRRIARAPDDVRPR